jgi:hypothetical protein
MKASTLAISSPPNIRRSNKPDSTTRMISIVAASIFALGFVAIAEAQSPDSWSEAEALTIDAKIYAELYDVTLEEAINRLLIMHGGIDAELAIAEEGDLLSGAYFDHATELSLVIDTLDAKAKPNKSIKVAARKETKELARSTRAERKAQRASIRQAAKLLDSEVERAEEALLKGASAKVKFKISKKPKKSDRIRKMKDNLPALRSVLPMAEFIADDEISGETIVFLNQTQSPSVAQQEAAANALQGPVRLQITSGFRPTSLNGGKPIQTSAAYNTPPPPSSPDQDAGPPTKKLCMSSFAMKRRADPAKGIAAKTGVLTARHCLDNFESLKSRGYLAQSATMQAWQESGAFSSVTPDVRSTAASLQNMHDIMFVWGSVPSAPKFFADSTGVPRTPTGYATRASTTASGYRFPVYDFTGKLIQAEVKGTIPGAFICHYGQLSAGSTTYKQTCGEVASTTGGITYLPAGTYVLIADRVKGGPGKSGLTSFGGDSGGPVFSNTIAYGVVQGSLAGHTATSGGSLVDQYLVYSAMDDLPTVFGLDLLTAANYDPSWKN